MAFRERVLHRSERMLKRACRRLPDGVRDERYREWAAELPAILDDPGTRWPLRRAARTLLFAADQRRSVVRLRPRKVAPATRPKPRRKLRSPAVRRPARYTGGIATSMCASMFAGFFGIPGIPGIASGVVAAIVTGALAALAVGLGGANRDSRGRGGSGRGSDGAW